uniref:Uncharacterized protein n=1 Tax=Onchocerca volvulus TaxID=6282 RepID=A0A8R1TWU6_ONCVO
MNGCGEILFFDEKYQHNCSRKKSSSYEDDNRSTENEKISDNNDITTGEYATNVKNADSVSYSSPTKIKI